MAIKEQRADATVQEGTASVALAGRDLCFCGRTPPKSLFQSTVGTSEQGQVLC